MSIPEALQPAPKPTSPLGYYRLLGPKSGLRVSPLCIGGMSFGTAWKGALNSCDQNLTNEILDYYHSKGGNFIDLANFYQDEESEIFVGNWMADRNRRDEMVIATKYSLSYRLYGEHTKRGTIQANFGGDGAKSMRVSVEASLKKLKTTYIDLLYVHHWTYDTDPEELMLQLNHLIERGLVLHIGASDLPAWVVSKCNQFARDRGLHQFSAYQGCWNASERAFEREILPMARADSMALTPWNVMGGGAFKTQAQWDDPNQRPVTFATDRHKAISKVLESVATKKGTVLSSVAIAYVMHKAPHVFPVIGGRSIKQMEQNIEALNLQLTKEEMDEIDDAAPFERGWPHDWIAPQVTHDEIQGPSDGWPFLFAYVDVPMRQKPIPGGVHGRY
jgi:aryl-alcohol dehydrogenase-like predicted oxidoreductase